MTAITNETLRVVQPITYKSYSLYRSGCTTRKVFIGKYFR